MIYNNERKTVRYLHNKGIDVSLAGGHSCPHCGTSIFGKRGEIKKWHWSHTSHDHYRICDNFTESEWHYTMKMAYGVFDNWTVETKIKVDSEEYVVDAINSTKDRLQIREAVHSLSPYYINKHINLSNLQADILWIFDLSVFRSANWRSTRDRKGVVNLFKPKAWDMVQKLDFKVLAHNGDRLFFPWKNKNIWYPCTGNASSSICDNYKDVKSILEEENE